MHSHARSLGILGGVFFRGGKGGVAAIYENPGFPVSKLGVSQSRVFENRWGHVSVRNCGRLQRGGNFPHKLDIFETPVTVTPQQKNKIQKLF